MLTAGRAVSFVACALSIWGAGCTTPVTRPFDPAQHAAQRMARHCPDAVNDGEGATYATVVVGEQCWFAENLAVNVARDGQPLLGTVAIDLDRYGRLYRHEHVTVTSGLCPEGWHVPTDEDMQVLEATLGMTPSEVEATSWRGEHNESLRLKASATAFSWTDEAKAQVNETGFSLLPAGEQIGFFTGADGIYAGLWTATSAGSDVAWVRYFVWNAATSNNTKIWRDAVDKERAYSVRCLRDG